MWPTAERALAHVAQLHGEAVRKPRSESDAGGLRAGDCVERIRRKGRLEIVGGQRGDRAPPAGLADQEAAVDIDRACPAGRQDERLLPADANGAGLPQQLGNLLAESPSWLHLADRPSQRLLAAEDDDLLAIDRKRGRDAADRLVSVMVPWLSGRP